MGEGDTFLNAVIGAAVTVVTASFIPFSPVVGGAVSGYLQGGDDEEVLKVGALSGLISLIPLILVLILVGNIFLLVAASGDPGFSALLGGFGALIFVVFLVSAIIYTVVLSAVGGWLGLYVREETDL
ncbi:hypothetical protein BRC65_07805 [Halobacteriales archaeon QH_2_65_14]|nr:MAG: hypothetical protein BRC65_07805 [Halobacteriales archaeon QH_2_65_14]